MAFSIDNRIVSMIFDNSKFLPGVIETIQSLTGLKSAMNLDETANQVNSSLDIISGKLNVWRMAAVNALSDVMIRAERAAESLVKSVTIDQVSAGWDKFEQKTKSVQTIVSATGKGIDEVNGYLEKLNWYSDETSYDFVDMVDNIGKFTNNRVELDKATTAMQGISNWAALAGQGAQQASRAMYNLSQAIGVGAVKLMDWRSIENANMATAEFKQSVLDTAVEIGTLTKDLDGLYRTADKGSQVTVENFSSTLSEGWFTADVLVDVLNEYGGFADALYDATQKTGTTATQFLGYMDDYADGTIDMARISEITGVSVEELTDIFEDLGSEAYATGRKAFKAAQEAKTWTDVVNATKDAVSSGWMQTFELIFGNYEEAKVFWTQLAGEMYELFAEGGNVRNALLEVWKEEGGRETLLGGLWNIIYTITDGIKMLKDAFHDVFPPMTAERLLEITQAFADFTEKLRPSEETLDKLRSVFGGFFAIIGMGIDLVGAIWKGLDPLWAGFGDAGDSILDAAAALGEWLKNARTTFQESEFLEDVTVRVSAAFKHVRNYIGEIIDILKGKSYLEAGGGLAGIIQSLFDVLSETVRMAVNFISAITGLKLGFLRDDIIKGITLIRDALVGLVKYLSGQASPIIESFIKALPGFADDIWNFVKKTLSSVKPMEMIGKIFSTAIDIIKTALSTVVPVAKVAFGVLKSVIKNVSDIAVALVNAVSAALTSGELTDLFEAFESGAFVGFSLSLSAFFKGIKNLTSGSDGVVKGIGNILNTVKDLLDSLTKEIDSKRILNIAEAVGILALSIVVLAGIDVGDLIKSLSGVEVLILELSSMMNLMTKAMGGSDIKRLFGKNGAAALMGTAMIEMAAAIGILAVAVRMLSDLDWDELAKGLIGVGGAMAALVLGMKTLIKALPESEIKGFSKNMLTLGPTLIAFGESIILLAGAIRIIGSMPLADWAKGLGGLAITIGLFTAAMFALVAMMDDTSIKGASAMMISLALAIDMLAAAVKKMGELSWTEIAKGLTGLTAIVIELCAALVILSDEYRGEQMLKAAGAIDLIALAVGSLASSVKKLSKLSWTELGKGLGSVTVLLAEMVISLEVLSKLSNTDLVSAAGSMVLFAAALDLLAISVAAFSGIGLGGLAVGLGGLAASIVVVVIAAGALSAVSGEILTASGALAAFSAASLLFGAALGVIGAGLVSLSAGLIAGSASIMAFGIEVVEFIPELLEALARSLGDALEAIVDGLNVIIQAVIKVIIDCVPLLVDALVALLDGIADSVDGLVDAVVKIFVNLLLALADNIGPVIDALWKVVKVTIEEFAKMFGEISMADLAKAILAMTEVAVLLGFLAADLVLADAAALLLLPLGATLSAFAKSIAPFMDALSMFSPEAIENAKALAQIMLIFSEAALLDGLSWLIGGKVSMAEFGKELALFGPYIKKYADSVKGVDTEIVTASANAAQALVVLSKDLPKHGGFLQAITGDNDLASFGQELYAFGNAMKKYGNTVKGIDAGAVTASSTAAESLATLANKLPNSGGIKSWFEGDNKLDRFGEQLGVFGENFKVYADNVKGIDPEVADSSVKVAEAMGAFLEEQPNTDFDMYGFSDQLSEFGRAMKEFNDNVKDVKVKEEVLTTISKIFTIMQDFPSIKSGLASMWNGQMDLRSFGQNIVTLAEHVKQLQVKGDGINTAAVGRITDSIKTVFDMMEEYPNFKNGIAKAFSGEMNIDDFGVNMWQLAGNIKLMQTAGDGLDPDTVGVVTESIGKVFTMMEGFPNLKNGIANVFAGEMNVDDFGTNMIQLAARMKNVQAVGEGLDPEKVTPITEAIGVVFTVMTTFPELKNGVANALTGTMNVDDFGVNMTQLAANLVLMQAAGEGLETESVTKIADAISSTFTTMSKFPKLENGLSSALTGDLSIGNFGERVKELASDLVEMQANGEGLDVDSVTNIADCLTKAFTAMEGFPEIQNGLASLFSGDMTIENFGDTVRQLASDLKNAQIDGKGLDPDESEIVFSTMTKAFEILNGFPEFKNGLSSLLSGTMTIENFGDTVRTLAGDLRDTQREGITIKEDAINEIFSAMVSSFQILTEFPEFKNGLKSLFSGDMTIENFGDTIRTLAGDLRDTQSAGASLKRAVLDEIFAAITSSFTIFNEFPVLNNGLKNLFSGQMTIGAFGDNVKGLAANILEMQKAADGGEGGTKLNKDRVIEVADAMMQVFIAFQDFPEIPKGGIFSSDLSLEAMGAQLEKFGPHLAAFVKDTEGIGVGATTGPASAITTIFTRIKGLEDLGDGTMAWFDAIADFGSDLEDFGPKFASFVGSTSDIEEGSVAGVSDAIKVFFTAMSELPDDTSKVLMWLSGDLNLSDLAGVLEEFGPKIASFVGSVSGISEDSVNSASNVGSAIAGLFDSIPDNAILNSKAYTLEEWGGQMELLIGSMIAFSNGVGSIKWSDFDLALVEAGHMADLADRLALMDFTGMTEFNTGLKVMASNGIQGFIDTFKDSFPTAKAAGGDFAQSVVDGLIEKEETFNTLGVSFGESISNGIISGQDSIEKSTTTIVHTVTAILASFKDDFTTAGKDLFVSLSSGMIDAKATVNSAANEISLDVYTLFEEFMAQMSNAGTDDISSLASGMLAGSYMTDDAAETISSSIRSVFNVLSDKLWTSGYNADLGLINGMDYGSGRVYSMAWELADGIVWTINHRLDENSPSKELFQTGMFADLGLALGMQKYTGQVEDAAVDVADTVLDTMSAAMTTAADIASGEIVVDPVIRPVMDLADVQYGASMIDGMLADQRVSAIETSQLAFDFSSLEDIAREIQNEDRVVDEIAAMREDLADLADAMSHLQVVLHDNTLVGSIAPSMDDQLGQILTYRGRGN